MLIPSTAVNAGRDTSNVEYIDSRLCPPQTLPSIKFIPSLNSEHNVKHYALKLSNTPTVPQRSSVPTAVAGDASRFVPTGPQSLAVS